MLECEKKVMLTKEEYEVIQKQWRTLRLEQQSNYYFDTDDFSMNKKGTTYRIRAKNGKYKATIKHHMRDCPGRSVEVDVCEKFEFDPQVFNGFGIHYQGVLVTYRAVIYKDSFCEMVLDRNVYLGHTDFELEVEYCKESEPGAQALIENIAECLVAAGHLTGPDDFLARIGQDGSKSQRFFERLKSFK